jgi:hypothetical protein
MCPALGAIVVSDRNTPTFTLTEALNPRSASVAMAGNGTFGNEDRVVEPMKAGLPDSPAPDHMKCSATSSCAHGLVRLTLS